MRSTTLEKGKCEIFINRFILITFRGWIIQFNYIALKTHLDRKRVDLVPLFSLIGKVAADHSHKWIHKEPSDTEINFLSAWHNSADSVSTHIYIYYLSLELAYISL
jgi:hypothetical protein